MLESSVVEIVLRGIPEGFLFIFAGHAISNSKIDLKRFLLSGSLLALIGSLIRYLPINFGVHSFLIIFVCIIILNNICKIPLIKAISSSLIIMIVGFATESINGLFLQYVLKKDMDMILNNSNPLVKVYYGIPSLILMGLIIWIVYYINKKRREKKNVSDREDIE